MLDNKGVTNRYAANKWAARSVSALIDAAYSRKRIKWSLDREFIDLQELILYEIACFANMHAGDCLAVNQIAIRCNVSVERIEPALQSLLVAQLVLQQKVEGDFLYSIVSQ